MNDPVAFSYKHEQLGLARLLGKCLGCLGINPPLIHICPFELCMVIFVLHMLKLYGSILSDQVVYFPD